MIKSKQKLIDYWIKLLNLEDWKIEVLDNCSPRELFDKDAQAENYYNFVHKCAKIRITSDKDRSHDIMPLDYEHLLVHELLHCKFAILDDSGNALQDKIVHQLVEDFTKALIERCRDDTEDVRR